MIIQPLASGSGGNAVWVASDTTRLLVDAGLSGPALLERLHLAGHNPKRINAIVLSHMHLDHTRGLRRVARKCGSPIFLHATHRERGMFSRLADLRPFREDEAFEVGDIRIEPFLVDHDASPAVGFRFTCAGRHLGFATDLGCAGERAREQLATCHVLYLEFNHDRQMLLEGPYPPQLRRRVDSDRGHLSNAQGAELLGELLCDELHHVILAHLSTTNNTPTLALQAARAILEERSRDQKVRLSIALQDRPSERIEV